MWRWAATPAEWIQPWWFTETLLRGGKETPKFNKADLIIYIIKGATAVSNIPTTVLKYIISQPLISRYISWILPSRGAKLKCRKFHRSNDLPEKTRRVVSFHHTVGQFATIVWGLRLLKYPKPHKRAFAESLLALSGFILVKNIRL